MPRITPEVRVKTAVRYLLEGASSLVYSVVASRYSMAGWPDIYFANAEFREKSGEFAPMFPFQGFLEIKGDGATTTIQRATLRKLSDRGVFAVVLRGTFEKDRSISLESTEGGKKRLAFRLYDYNGEEMRFPSDVPKVFYPKANCTRMQSQKPMQFLAWLFAAFKESPAGLYFTSTIPHSMELAWDYFRYSSVEDHAYRIANRNHKTGLDSFLRDADNKRNAKKTAKKRGAKTAEKKTAKKTEKKTAKKVVKKVAKEAVVERKFGAIPDGYAGFSRA